MFPRLLTFLLIITFSWTALNAQLIEPTSSSSVKQSIKKLNVLCSVLYLAAHPDDENTRLISYFSNDLLARTAYLSLTRGDGGQNLIGTEKGDALGVLRTQELLAARRIDGGEQFFTRAIDFGYSKNPEETFEIWDKEKILHDVVLAIRQFRPDVIITRFPPSEYAGHGHHTASAMLAEEAYRAAWDSTVFPEHFTERGLKPWLVTRVYFNASSWWNKDIAKEAAGSDKFVTIDIGTYNPELGLSYGELAAESRSQHKSQGFGSARQRGSSVEYLQYQHGEVASDNNILELVNTSWSKFGKVGNAIETSINKAYDTYNPYHPATSVHHLLHARKMMISLSKNDPLVASKMRDLDALVVRMCGIFYETTSEFAEATRGEQVKLTVSAINRSTIPVTLKQVTFNGTTYRYDSTLKFNQLEGIQMDVTIPEDMPYSNPYWLNKPASQGAFTVEDPLLIGKAEHYDLPVKYEFVIDSETVVVEAPVQYKWVDREKGELYRPFVILPAVTVNISDPVYIFSGESSKTIEVRLRAQAANMEGTVKLQGTDNWKISPAEIPFKTTAKGEEKVISFTVTPPQNALISEFTAVAVVGKKELNQRLDIIDYDHIPLQTLLSKSTTKLIRLDIEKKGNRIAYVMGAGDDVPESLKQIGYEVEMIEPDKLAGTDLSAFDAVIFGVRAFNVNEKLAYTREKLEQFMQNGGNVIVQYNTSRGSEASDFSPYPLYLSRDRVTREEATPTILQPKHPIFTIPNKITETDFEGWVQERGLYFANEWDSHFTPLISWHDPDELPKDGGLLVADYGKGAFIYTGISFFRQLPAGVPGAFRLITNLISYTPDEKAQ